MIKTFRHKGLKVFFEEGSMPVFRLPMRHGWPVKGSILKGHFSVRVSGNWRMTFTFDGADAVLVDYQDYH